MSTCLTTGVPSQYCTCVKCQKPAEPPAEACSAIGCDGKRGDRCNRADCPGDQAQIPHNVECMDCHHVWVGFYLPQSIDTACKIMSSLRCPKCGAGPQRITIAQEDTQ